MIRSPWRVTNGSNTRAASSTLMGPSRTTCGTARSGELALDEAQHVLRVLAHLHLGEHAANRAAAVDDERGAVDPEELAPEEALGAEDSVGRADLGAGIAQKEERQPVLGGEGLVRCERVAADAEDDRVALLEVRVGVAETARLHGAAGCRVLGVEIEDEILLADEIPQADPLAAGAHEREIGGLRADLGSRVHLHAVPPVVRPAPASLHPGPGCRGPCAEFYHSARGEPAGIVRGAGVLLA